VKKVEKKGSKYGQKIIFEGKNNDYHEGSPWESRIVGFGRS